MPPFFVQEVAVKEEEDIKMKAKEEELRKVFQTTVSLCVHNGLMTPERAHGFYRSGEVHVDVCGLLRSIWK